ncbi:type II toxin-antitoxin system Phd/YefM family antitoxin [Pseudomonas sp. DP-17]|uniref:type II toxin-antitoxin system Phd/YefM family antitoxin n=1 Tax=Pseudomonas sp. DP-17 TaxID=1580486 RepID=UPI001EFBE79E|nr:type II toxin-antitoxin system Phd/YefM family antitoxin [Pseudomonas sp. DP-17]MCG8911435.1 type II toxin-antitoxin system Phd/YefM family antitoxin [Pseudomonas sp. DP-17]
MRVIAFAEAAEDLQKVIDGIVAREGAIVIRGEAGADVVLLSMGHFNGLMETLHLLRSPANSAHLARSEAQLGSRIYERFKSLGGVDGEEFGWGGKKD